MESLFAHRCYNGAIVAGRQVSTRPSRNKLMNKRVPDKGLPKDGPAVTPPPSSGTHAVNPPPTSWPSNDAPPSSSRNDAVTPPVRPPPSSGPYHCNNPRSKRYRRQRKLVSPARQCPYRHRRHRRHRLPLRFIPPNPKHAQQIIALHRILRHPRRRQKHMVNVNLLIDCI